MLPAPSPQPITIKFLVTITTFGLMSLLVTLWFISIYNTKTVGGSAPFGGWYSPEPSQAQAAIGGALLTIINVALHLFVRRLSWIMLWSLAFAALVLSIAASN